MTTLIRFFLWKASLVNRLVGRCGSHPAEGVDDGTVWIMLAILAAELAAVSALLIRFAVA